MLWRPASAYSRATAHFQKTTSASQASSSCGEALSSTDRPTPRSPYERALAIYESFHGPDHPRTTNTRDTIKRLQGNR